MHASFITMVKEPFESFLKTSILGRAQEKKILTTKVFSLLDSVGGYHHKLDDTPYGGGPGELLRIDKIRSQKFSEDLDGLSEFPDPQDLALDHGNKFQ